MFKVYIFAAVVLFWVSLSASLMHLQLAASPMYRMRVPTYRSMSIHSTTVAEVQSVPTPVDYN